MLVDLQSPKPPSFKPSHSTPTAPQGSAIIVDETIRRFIDYFAIECRTIRPSPLAASSVHRIPFLLSKCICITVWRM